MIDRSPILITGSHRSGSTWVGKMIAKSPSVGYIHEPFNVRHRAGICKAKWDYWFQYVCEENESRYYQHIKETLSFMYHPIKQLLAIRRRRDPINFISDFKDFTRYRIKKVRPLLKDPIAFFSAEWLAKRFDMEVIVLIRHPAAFAGSLKKMNWNFNFSNFLNQPLLMRDYLHPFESEIKKFTVTEYDLIDQAILLWNIIHYMICYYKQRHPNWIFLRHEDISYDPLKGFASIFRRLNLEWSNDIENEVAVYCNSNNPTERNSDTEDFFKRNSKLNIWNWKTRLTEPEIFRISTQTQEISKEFYSDEDWGLENIGHNLTRFDQKTTLQFA